MSYLSTEQRRAQIGYWQKECPECGLVVHVWDMTCPGCEHDLRQMCEHCGLPILGPTPVCHCDPFDPETMEALRRTMPAKVEPPDGGQGHGHLRFRRANSGY